MHKTDYLTDLQVKNLNIMTNSAKDKKETKKMHITLNPSFICVFQIFTVHTFVPKFKF